MTDEFEGLDNHVSLRSEWARVPGHYRAMMAPTTSIPNALTRRREDSWPAPLEECPVPVMLIRGTRDDLLEFGWADRIAAVSDNAQVVDLDSKHCPNIDSPISLLDALVSFVN